MAAGGGRVGVMANEIARSLRKRMTPQEVKLWVHLRSWRKRGFGFRRQAPRDGHVIDFVCLKHRLMVEAVSIISLRMRGAMRSATITSPAEASRYCVSGTMKSIEIWRAC